MKSSRNHFIKAILISAMMLPLSACGSVNSTDSNNTAQESDLEEVTQEQVVTGNEPKEKQEPIVTLTEAELQEFTELFNSDEYNGFLLESYNSPEEINWDSVLEFGAGLSVQEVSEDEINDYLESIGEKDLYGDLFVIRKSDLAEYIIQHTGLSNIADDVLSWDYVPKYDSYYKEHWAAHQNQYTCVSGEKVGDHYELRFRVNSEELPGTNAGKNYGKWADRVLKMTRTSDTMVFESNVIQWDDYCDEEQTFDVELSQYDGPVHFVTYSANPDETDITIVKDGKFLADLYTSIYSEDGTKYLKKVIAVGFFDFNSDGMDDIAVIGDSDLGKHVLLYESVPGDYPFESFADLNEEKMSDIGCDFTIAGVKEALLGDKQKEQYSSYQDLYMHLAKVYSIQDDKNQFDLIYADADDIPEFVVGYAGYWVSLVAYENGKAHYLMNRWPYGAGGNSGYSYAPKKGIYYNGNADYAGAIYYNTYMSKRDEGELGTDYWVKDINFNDLDGDGWPSDDELQASGEYVGSSEYHNETGKDMTEDEIKEVISLYESYEMKQISGRMDYPTFLDKLAGKEVGITEEQALAAIKKHCLENNADLEDTVNSGKYTVYWNVESIDDADIVVLYRSYTGSQLRYYMLDAFEIGLITNIKRERRFNRTVGNDSIGIKVQTSGIADPTCNEGCSNVDLQAFIRRGDYMAALKGTDNFFKYKAQIITLMDIREDYAIVNAHVYALDDEKYGSYVKYLNRENSIAGTAEAEGVSEEAIKSRFYRAKKLLIKNAKSQIENNLNYSLLKKGA